ncbi:pilus assembly protein TadG-related protein [Streptomyces sp. NPDC058667]|uniref:pilus assembly protein TadG-related protein n=1 Tax=Streptomyces sp. NPDC058667 TaxID=3346588 RepID=UPI003650E7AB
MHSFRSDSGQAFPVYIAVVAGLLFLAFAYFAVGQAASTRNSAQTAADAAALAAAQDARDQLREGWLEVIFDPDQWGGYLAGKAYDSFSACESAADFAARNQAVLTSPGCEPHFSESNGFRVTVLTTGGEANSARASAMAVIEPRCTFERQEPSPEPSTSPPAPPPSGEPEEEEPGPIVGLTCDGESWDIDPKDPRLPGVTELFTVRLSE